MKQTHITSFYIVAHADDWQLFMFPSCYYDLLNENNRTVFIYITAGDAGMEPSFWRGREKAAMESVRHCLDNVPGGFWKDLKIINGKQVECRNFENTASYFMRLPDGGLDGKGFGKGSIQQLLNGEMNSITTIDGANRYTLPELRNTLGTIISQESANTSVSVHYPGFHEANNPHDHPDHIATGRLIDSISLKQRLKRFTYRGYTCESEAEKLPSDEHKLKHSLFGAYNAVMITSCNYDTFKEDIHLYERWLSTKNDYTRVREKEIKFIADVHLGKLARILRMLGFDAVYRNDYSKQEQHQIARAEERILLSRDPNFKEYKDITFFRVTSPDAREQIRQVVAHFGLKSLFNPFIRCLYCNDMLEVVTKDEVEKSLQPQTREFFAKFWKCDCCGRIYWKGSHYERMMGLVRELEAV